MTPLGGACFPARGVILSGGYPLRRGKKAALFRPRAISKMTRPEGVQRHISRANVDAFIVENSDVSVTISPNFPDQTGVYPHRGNRNIGAANDVADENKPARIDGRPEKYVYETEWKEFFRRSLRVFRRRADGDAVQNSVVEFECVSGEIGHKRGLSGL
jgi:hypothetical protein